MKFNIAESFGINLNEAWKEEYKRVGHLYARWGALLVIFLFPLSTIPELAIEKPNINLWYIFRYGPSVVVGVVFLLHQKFKFSHELLFEIIAFCLFTSAAYMVDCADWMTYMISMVTVFITSAVLVILRPFYFILNFFAVFLIQIIVHTFFCDAGILDYFMMKGVNILIVVGIAAFSMAAFRYYIMKNNFMHRVALQEAHFELQERNQSLIKAQKDLRFKSDQISEQNEELKMQKEEILSQRDAMQSQKEFIEKQNRDIIGSIRYAQRIQSAMLPTDDYIKQLLPNSFVMFIPRDIVSGDFYWMAEVDGKKVIAAIDCTGHGVPGAFMSLVGDTNMNQIVLQEGTIDPAEILNRLHDGVNSYLKQSQTENQDGMDASIVIIDEQNKIMTFAGAKNPLIIVKENREVEVIKGDKMSIGGKRKIENGGGFTTHSIEYNPNHTFYIFSDGYQDQFGGPKDKKFMVRNFRKLLQETAEKDMNDQIHILKKRFEDWKRGYSQTDDVLLIGFRLQ
ncbi:SpoIIE family protein phosphatase [Marivirga harenae]|uniref:PP2C family protein-serine/threonine phosphatase n=1 Tax=Marivirga harenae TaxID=2010992 RepID=UPI0026DF9610|nr:SpoIIE family protein phosphatase [Marivirga harenae]WKV11966.1 SpoIIE family protein phosphatase [Marivirga harenae]|tara:strand:- start:62370 stop:63896 length:1527 start_codon:yes stop_codon:yes gene_type:complete